MENLVSPSQHIYKLYEEYEKRGMDTAPISQAIQQVTGTEGKSNLEVVTRWIKDMESSNKCELI
mgnify:CR=1 FL=1